MPWRGILPLVHIAIYTVLVGWGYQERCLSLPATGAIQLEPFSVDHPPPFGYRLAVAINLPALLPLGLIAAALPQLLTGLDPCQMELTQLAILGSFAYLLWTGIGWWIDRKKAGGPQLGPPRRILMVAVLLVSVPAVLIGLIATTSALLSFDSNAAVFAAGTLWFGAASTGAIATIRERR